MQCNHQLLPHVTEQVVMSKRHNIATPPSSMGSYPISQLILDPNLYKRPGRSPGCLWDTEMGLSVAALQQPTCVTDLARADWWLHAGRLGPPLHSACQCRGMTLAGGCSQTGCPSRHRRCRACHCRGVRRSQRSWPACNAGGGMRSLTLTLIFTAYCIIMLYYITIKVSKRSSYMIWPHRQGVEGGACIAWLGGLTEKLSLPLWRLAMNMVVMSY